MNVRAKNLNRNKIDYILNMAVFQLPLLVLDSFGVVYLISAIGILHILYVEEPQEELSRKADKFDIVWMIAGIAVMLLVSVLTILGKTGSMLEFRGIILIPTWLVLFYYITPIFWGCYHKKELRHFFMIDRNVLKHVSATIFIFGVVAVLSALQRDISSYASDHQYIQNVFQFIFGAALSEELFFRGFLYNLLKKIFNYKVIFARIVSSFIFTIIHVNLLMILFENYSFHSFYNLIVIFFLGFVSCIIYEKSKSLIPSIVFHACFNGTITELVLLGSKLL